jgi:DNA-binding CsgD family transcriptional regulator
LSQRRVFSDSIEHLRDEPIEVRMFGSRSSHRFPGPKTGHEVELFFSLIVRPGSWGHAWRFLASRTHFQVWHTTYESEEDIRRAVIAGANGYLVKVADPQQIQDAVRQVAAGHTAFPPDIALNLVQSIGRPNLSKRELQVLQYVANARSNKEIGAILYVSETTIKGHVRSILGQLGATCRAGAVAMAIKRGAHPIGLGVYHAPFG